MTIKEQNKMMFEMNVLDFLIISDDPSRESIYKINVKAREVGSVEWLKTNEPSYFIPEDEMVGYLEA